ncbi:vacuolar protein sorting-associated protein 55 homolog isoform X1 [Triticum aestivum]|nr:vacuolar protein sorting-associated protein 55 homolog isoform X1 [Triticum aestivum]
MISRLFPWGRSVGQRSYWSRRGEESRRRRQTGARPPAGDGDDRGRLAGLACMFSTSVLLQILACALYNNWWPMLAALMYIIVPMPCLFFGDGSTRFLSSGEGGAWMKAAKFLTGMSAMGSLAIPAILRHAGLIETGAMFIEFTSFFILVCTVLCFHRATLDEEW